MGCSESRVQLFQVENPLITTFEEIEDQTIDKKFQEAEKSLKELETLRKFVVEEKDALVLLSGACCKIDPTIISIIESLLWTISKENKGDISNQITYNEEQYPYFSIGENNSDCSKKISKEINEYIKKALDYELTFVKLKEKCEEIIRHFRNNQAKYRNSLLKAEKDVAVEAFDRNINLVQQMTKGNTLYLIIDKLDVDLNNIKIIQSLLANNNFMKEVNSIGKKSQNFNNQYEITYYNINTNQRYKTAPSEGEIDYKTKIDKRKEVCITS